MKDTSTRNAKCQGRSLAFLAYQSSRAGTYSFRRTLTSVDRHISQVFRSMTLRMASSRICADSRLGALTEK